MLLGTLYQLNRMKYILLFLLLLSSAILHSQVKPIPFTLNDIAYPIIAMKRSPGADLLFMSLTGGRFLLYETGKGKLNEHSSPLWKNYSVTGFEYGGDAEFSDDQKYILVSEQNLMVTYDKVQVKPFRIVVLDAATGSIIYELGEVTQTQFIKGKPSIMAFLEEEIVIFDLQTKKVQKLTSPLEIESGCLNQAGNLIAIAYDAGMEEFKTKHGAGYNRKELKNARKNKKLMAFFEYPSMKKIGTLQEEIDVVYMMKFIADDRYLLFFSRTKQAEHQQTSVLNDLDKQKDRNQFQRVDIASMKVDNLNFIYQTSEAQSNCDFDLNNAIFVYGDNRGLLSAKREVVVVNFNQQQDYLGKYTYQGRAGTRNLYSTAFSIHDATTILVANGMKLSYWDFRQLPAYSEFVEPMNENAILDKAVAQLETDLQDPGSNLSKTIVKKNIHGLFILTITLQKNGEVVSVFAQSDEKTDINSQNQLKDLMMKYRFDVSVPKNERVKFTYTFNL